MSRKPAVCEFCGSPFGLKDLRTVCLTGRVYHLCKLCFLKLPEEDRAHSKAETKLRHQVEYTQAELPF